MGEVGEGFAALSEAVVFLNHFKDLPDPRQLGADGAEAFVDIARFGEKRSTCCAGFAHFGNVSSFV
jgi:hypothetical protein